MIIDSANIVVRSGRGGDGCVSFRRMKYVPKGGPDGGDGGKGGSVILVASHNVETLLDCAGRHHWFADKGQPGGGSQKHGKDGADCTVHLPPGTLVFNDETGELIVDLAEPGMEFVVAKGGKGGFGNEHFATATNQAPRTSTPGEPAEEFTLRLELKLIADVGLVGKPNAGKSTLLSRISAATPKIADYPFTTLDPNLGIAELSGHRRVVVADIPGLIEKASLGQGLGTRFLRHVERTRLLVHLIEAEPLDGSDPAENYRVIRKELEGYGGGLADKREIIALSKMDLVGDAEDQAVAAELVEQALGAKVIPLSAATGAGLTDLLEACWAQLSLEDEPHLKWGASDSRASESPAREQPADPAEEGATPPSTNDSRD